MGTQNAKVQPIQEGDHRQQWIVPKCKFGFEFGLTLLITNLLFSVLILCLEFIFEICDMLDMSITYAQTFSRFFENI